MFTSVINKSSRPFKEADNAAAGCDPLKTGMRYLIASIIIAAAAAVYRLFSHGVYSYYMTYAFMIPLLAGALPHLTAAMRGSDRSGDSRSRENPAESETAAASKLPVIKDMQLAVIATLTAGSLLKGALDIYGTTNRLMIVYPVMAAIIVVIAVISEIKKRK